MSAKDDFWRTSSPFLHLTAQPHADITERGISFFQVFSSFIAASAPGTEYPDNLIQFVI